MSGYVFDTDMLSLYQRGHATVIQNAILHVSAGSAVTVITVEEQRRKSRRQEIIIIDVERPESYNVAQFKSPWKREAPDAAKREMPKLPSNCGRLASRMVQDGRAGALSRTVGNGLSVLRTSGRISTRKDRNGAAERATRPALCR